MDGWMHACTYVCMYGCMNAYLCMYVCMYVCIYACMYVHPTPRQPIFLTVSACVAAVVVLALTHLIVHAQYLVWSSCAILGLSVLLV